MLLDCRGFKLGGLAILLSTLLKRSTKQPMCSYRVMCVIAVLYNPSRPPPFESKSGKGKTAELAAGRAASPAAVCQEYDQV